MRAGSSTPSVLAIAAHPDDIEFVMAGTLLLLGKVGYELHYFNLANGCCGSMHEDRNATAMRRLAEAQASAAMMGAHFHLPICDDMGVYYESSQLAKVSAVVRQVRPTIVLTHSPIDYMEDHMNTCRLAVSATFSKGMPNAASHPPTPAAVGDVAIYHAQPHGNRTPMGELVYPAIGIDVESVLERKRACLGCHASQEAWLDVTQKMSSYVATMHELGAEVASLLGRTGFAEGWRQRHGLGYGPVGWDPLGEALAGYVWRGA